MTEQPEKDWRGRAIAAFHELERELTERFYGPLGMAAWITPAEERELLVRFAQYHLARHQPLLAAVSRLEVVETPDGDAELRHRVLIGTERGQEQLFGGAFRVERHVPLTRLGQLHGAVREQVEHTLRSAERTIAAALMKDRSR